MIRYDGEFVSNIKDIGGPPDETLKEIMKWNWLEKCTLFLKNLRKFYVFVWYYHITNQHCESL